MDAERAFVIASQKLSDADLFSATISTLVSNPRKPPLFFSFAALYKDPLIVLKCPINLFVRKGWRRLAVFVMSVLLEINEFVVSQSCPDKDAENEYIFARNAILMRNLVSIMSGEVDRIEEIHCSLAVGLVRRIVAKKTGSPALLIKHQASENCIDWMVDNVPETIEDGQALASILSEQSSLTAAERLVAADGVLRSAIVHGHHHEDETLVLAHAAFSILISSFFLVLGPVGVPVSTLVGEGNGTDSTHVARKAAFRLVQAMSGGLE